MFICLKLDWNSLKTLMIRWAIGLERGNFAVCLFLRFVCRVVVNRFDVLMTSNLSNFSGRNVIIHQFLDKMFSCAMVHMQVFALLPVVVRTASHRLTFELARSVLLIIQESSDWTTFDVVLIFKHLWLCFSCISRIFASASFRLSFGRKLNVANSFCIEYQL